MRIENKNENRMRMKVNHSKSNQNCYKSVGFGFYWNKLLIVGVVCILYKSISNNVVVRSRRTWRWKIRRFLRTREPMD